MSSCSAAHGGMTDIPPSRRSACELDSGRALLLPHLGVRAGAARRGVRNLLDSRTGPRDPRAAGRAIDGRELRRRPRAAEDHRVRLRRAARGALRAGCTRICSASSIRRRSASTSASNTCSWRWSAARATSGAPCSAPRSRSSRNCCRTCCPQLRRKRQLRDHRLRRADRAAAAARRDGVLAAGRALAARAAPPPRSTRRRARCRRARSPRPASRCSQSRRRASTSAGWSRSTTCRFDMQAGEILGLIGPNGAGKSTHVQPDHRRAARRRRRDHVPAASASPAWPPREIARLGIARTFQHVKLISQMTVLDNVALGAHLRGSQGTLRAMLRARPRRGGAPAARSGAPDRARRPGEHMHDAAGSLPLGQQRIVEIARALAPTRRCCCSTSRPPGCATRRSRSSPSCCGACARGHEHPAGRARHGLRHGPDRPPGRDGLRREARRRRAGARSSATRPCSKPISVASHERARSRSKDLRVRYGKVEARARRRPAMSTPGRSSP